MDYIQPCKKYKYFAATKTGQMPTPHKYEYDATKKDLETCLKGWPEKEWAIFRVVFKQQEKEYIFDRIDVRVEDYWQQFLLPDLIAQFVNTRYTSKAIDTKAVRA